MNRSYTDMSRAGPRESLVWQVWGDASHLSYVHRIPNTLVSRPPASEQHITPLARDGEKGGKEQTFWPVGVKRASLGCLR